MPRARLDNSLSQHNGSDSSPRWSVSAKEVLMHTGLCFVFHVLLLVTLTQALSKRATEEAHIVGEYTGEVAINVPVGVDAAAVAERFNYEYLGYALGKQTPHLHLIRAKNYSTHDELENADDINWFAPQMRRERYKRTLEITDPLYSKQWHLGVLNVMGAWDAGINGTGVQVCVVDDGLDHGHPDFAGKYDPQGSFDVNYNDPDPSPSNRDSHGTSSTGVAAAGVNNGACGVGVAFGSTVSHVRMLARGTTDSQEAQALSYKCEDINDVYSNSWGPNDDGKRLEGPGRVLLDAFEHCIANGRGGLGSVYAWAGGNGKSSGDNINYDGYANLRYTIPFGSISDNRRSTWYSEPGAPLFAVTPSSGSSGISTTDLRGSAGASRGDCTDSFGGTSASSPMGAGILALVLQANPNMSWRDIQHLVVQSTVQVDNSNHDWVQNGAGRWVNHQYGFGLIDASAAVRNAQQWESVGPEENATATFGDDGQFRYGQQGTTVSLTLERNVSVESVEVFIAATTPGGRGRTVIDLTSPAGTMSRLQARHADTHTSIAWTYLTVRCWDEPSAGTWQLTMSSTTAGSLVTRAKLTVFGTAIENSDEGDGDQNSDSDGTGGGTPDPGTARN